MLPFDVLQDFSWDMGVFWGSRYGCSMCCDRLSIIRRKN
jgi:hypothetical protein